MNEYELYVDLERVYTRLNNGNVESAIEILGEILADMDYENEGDKRYSSN